MTACFPAGTPVAVEGGYKNIEDVQAGELVWAWHEQTGDLVLKPVLQTMQRDAAGAFLNLCNCRPHGGIHYGAENLHQFADNYTGAAAVEAMLGPNYV